MKAKKTFGIILMLPLILLVFASFGAAIYAAYFKIQNITWAASVIIGLFIILYLIGLYLLREKKEKDGEKGTKENM